MRQELKARNSDFEKVVRESFARQAMMTSLGARLSLVEPGRVHIAMDRSDRFSQQHGFLHAGAVTSIADSACGYAAYSLAPAGTEVLSVEFKVNLVAPARSPRFEARAQVLRSGATLTSCFAQVFGLGEGDEVLVAAMLSTLIIRPTGRPPSTEAP